MEAGKHDIGTPINEALESHYKIQLELKDQQLEEAKVLLEQAKEKMEKLHFEINVTNTGDRDGKEIVQLYIRDLVGSLTRPVRELKGFQRIEIPAGESRTVSFTITEEDLAYWHLAEGVTLGADGAYTFSAEPGDFHIWIAPNAAEGQPAKFTLQ